MKFKIFLLALLAGSPAFAGDLLYPGGRNGIVEQGSGGGGGAPSGTATGDVDMATFYLRYTAGTEALPGFTPTGDPDTGISASAANNFDISTGGTYRLRLNSTRLLPSVPIYAPNGTTGAPSYSFAAAPTTGIWSPGTNQIGFSTNGVNRLTLGSGGDFDSQNTAARILFYEYSMGGAATLNGSTTLDQVVLGLTSGEGNQFILGTVAFRSSDYGHTPQTNPTLYGHSAQDPTGAGANEWWSITQDQTNTVLDLGEGFLDIPDGARQIRVISATPAAPYTCNVTNVGRDAVYVDDTNDVLGSAQCFCGTIADDTTYDWLLVGTTPAVPVACPFF